MFRHFDSASVVKGLVGEPPKTAWVIGYPLFERIYYLLVAGYDPYGNLGHQLNSRLYMDFMRMEGEINFLLLLPQGRARADARLLVPRRERRRARPTSTAASDRSTLETGIAYRSQDPQRELLRACSSQRLAPVLAPRFELAARAPTPRCAQPLQRLAARARRAACRGCPRAVVLRVDDAGRARRTTSACCATPAHANVSHLLRRDGASCCRTRTR